MGDGEQSRRRRPEAVKSLGYLVSCVSVALLGVAAYPGAQRAGLGWALITGMAASVAGMALRWWSYELEKRREAARRDGRHQEAASIRGTNHRFNGS